MHTIKNYISEFQSTIILIAHCHRYFFDRMLNAYLFLFLFLINFSTAPLKVIHACIQSITPTQPCHNHRENSQTILVSVYFSRKGILFFLFLPFSRTYISSVLLTLRSSITANISIAKNIENLSHLK